MDDRIFFSARQVVVANKVVDPATGRIAYKPFYHSTVRNPDGSRKRYAKIWIPDKDHRKFTFTADENGLERNGRRGYIQVPYENVRTITKDGKKTLQSFLIINNASEAVFTVYFQNHRDKVTGKFDHPQSCKVSLKELKQIFVRMEIDVKRDLGLDRPKPENKQEKAKSPNRKKDLGKAR